MRALVATGNQAAALELRDVGEPSPGANESLVDVKAVSINRGELRLLATRFGHPITYTCVPPGSGERIGVDRDGDGVWDGDERDAHSDPADPTSALATR